MPHSAASDLILYCLPMSHKMDARLIWVNLIKQLHCLFAFQQSFSHVGTNEADLKKKLACRAPTYPPKTRPTQKIYCLSEIFFSNSINKPFFKIIKSCILMKKGYRDCYYTAFVDL